MSNNFKFVAENGERILLLTVNENGEFFKGDKKFDKTISGVNEPNPRAYTVVDSVQYMFRKRENTQEAFEQLVKYAREWNKKLAAQKNATAEAKSGNKGASLKVTTHTAYVEELRAIKDNPTGNKLTTLREERDKLVKLVEEWEAKAEESAKWTDDDWKKKFAEAAKMDEEATKANEAAAKARKDFEAMVRVFVGLGMSEANARAQAKAATEAAAAAVEAERAKAAEAEEAKKQAEAERAARHAEAEAQAAKREAEEAERAEEANRKIAASASAQ